MCLLESDIWGKKKDAVKHRLKNSKTATLLASQHTLHFLNQPNEGAEGGGGAQWNYRPRASARPPCTRSSAGVFFSFFLSMTICVRHFVLRYFVLPTGKCFFSPSRQVHAVDKMRFTRRSSLLLKDLIPTFVEEGMRRKCCTRV